MSGPASVELALTATDQLIHLSWDAGELRVSEWLVLRDGAPLRKLPPKARELDDETAPPGRLDSFDASATIAVPDGIELEWTIPKGIEGSEVTYQLLASVDGGYLVSNEATGYRTAPSVRGFVITTSDAGWRFDAGTTFWLDTSAPSPGVSVSGLFATATPDDYTTSVVLRVDAGMTRSLIPVSYSIQAEPTSGLGSSVEAQGARGGNRVELQWQRSGADSPDAWVDLPYVHGRVWLDREAVLNEGRYYRVAARAAGQEWVSNEVRAFLVAPNKLVGRYLLRDDGAIYRLGDTRTPSDLDPAPPFQVEPPGPAIDLVVLSTNYSETPCALMAGGEVVCWKPSGRTVMPFPPATRLTAGSVLCVNTTDGGLICDPPTFDVSELQDVIVAGAILCGHVADAGVQCVGAFPQRDLVPPPVGMWASPAGVVASYADGTAVNLVGPGPWLPIADGGYLTGAFNGGGAESCGVRADGRLVCAENQYAYDMGTPRSERYRSFGFAYPGACGLTVDRRVRCVGDTLVSAPPRPPVVASNVLGHVASVAFVLADGTLDWHSLVLTIPLTPEDHITQVAGSLGPCAALRADGHAIVGNQTPQHTYQKVACDLGLMRDGGIDLFFGAWNFVGAATDIQEDAQGTFVRHVDGGWESSTPPRYGPIPPGDFPQITDGCGLTARGRLVCWGSPIPPQLSALRFRHLSHTASYCATTLEGDVYCWPGEYEPITKFSSTWEDFVDFEVNQQRNEGCGRRRDGTATCTTGHPYSHVFYTPPWDALGP